MNRNPLRLAGFLAAAALLPACGVGGGGGTLTPTVAPGIPENVEVRPGNRSATITWDATATGASYTVLRSLNSSGPFFPISVPAQFRGPTTYVDAGLANGTSYYYEVQAGNTFGNSAPAPVVSGTPGFRPVSISGGPYHELAAVLADGTVWQWGYLPSGISADTPVIVPGLQNITAVSIGGAHGLALDSQGKVWAWGNQSSGQLGSGAVPINQSFPAGPVANLTGMTAVAAGNLFSLALSHDGTVWAWGENVYAQMGNGAVSNTPTIVPTQVPGLSRMVAIAAGYRYALALRDDGLVWGWGSNDRGQASSGSVSTFQLSPVLVADLNGVTAIAAGVSHSLVLRNDGTVWGWGDNTSGSLGTGSTSPMAVLKPVKALINGSVSAIGCGSSQSLAVLSDGTVRSWGGNVVAQLGNGSNVTTPFPTPAPVVGLTGIALVAGSAGNSAALGIDGSLWTWGDNTYGQLGNLTGTYQPVPLQVPNVTGVIDVAAGNRTSLVLRSDGTVWGWGNNEAGQLGNGSIDTTGLLLPVKALGVVQATHLSSGFATAGVRLANGTVMGWGGNSLGEVGNGGIATAVSTPVACPALNSISSIAYGYSHAMALQSDGTAWAWGYNGIGALGYGTNNLNYPTPAVIPNLPKMASVSPGVSFSLAAGLDGSVWSWGSGIYGQLGLGAVNFAGPTQIPNFGGIVRVCAGYGHSLALGADGRVWSWGDNALGQLGDGTTIGRSVPGLVVGLTGVVALAQGQDHNVALRNDGTVWTWGANSYGVLGNVDVLSSSVPIQVPDLVGVTSIAAGVYHNLAALSNGTVWGWGENGLSALGVPYVPKSNVPVLVAP